MFRTYGKKISGSEIMVLGLVLATALVLRLWGTSFGLPHIHHSDEGFEVYRAVRLGMGSFDFDRWAKGGYYFLLFFEYGVYFVLMWVTGAVSSVSDFAVQFVNDPSLFWKIGRVTTAILGTCTVCLSWWQGRRMGGPWVGLFTAWFLALSFRHVEDSHYITVDVPMTLFAFWSVVMVVEDVEKRQRLNPYLFAFVAAFALLNKITAVVLFVPYFVGSLLRGGVRGHRGLLTAATLLPVVGAGVIYLVANPSFVTNLYHVFYFLRDVFFGLPVTDQHTVVVQQTNLWLFYISALAKSQGLGVLVMAVFGVGVAIARRSRGMLIHLAFVLPLFLLIAGSSPGTLYYERYITPLLPGLCLFAGIGLEAAIRQLPLRKGTEFLVASTVAILLTLEPGLASIRFDQKLTRPDTRTLALHWVEENIPDGSRILLEGFPEASSQLSVPLKNTERNIRTMIERLEKTDPGKAKYWKLKLQVQSPPAYDLVTVRYREAFGALAEYRNQGVEYMVLRRDRFVPGRSYPRLSVQAVQSRYSFYEELRKDKRNDLLIAFDPALSGDGGYGIEVWRVR
jgi:hypothetical protein